MDKIVNGNILEVRELDKRYTDFCLKNINLSLPYGKILGIVGENGAGKTTIIKILLNAIRRDSGDIKIFGKDNILFELDIKKRIGICLDQCYFDESLDACVITSIMKYIYDSWSSDKFISLIKEFNIPIRKRIKEYSKGMKAKLNIAVSLASNPEFIILDEPTAGLDPVVRNDILAKFRSYVDETNASILFSSHITSDIEKIADIVTFIHNGELLLTVTRKEICNDIFEILLSPEQFHDLQKKEIIAYQKNLNNYYVLVRKVTAKRYQNAEHVSVEKMLLYLVKGER